MIELALDRLEATLATELPGHVRAFAAAYATGRAAPPAPGVAADPRSLATAVIAARDAELAPRALRLVRLVAPLVVERDARVVAARAAPPSWDALAHLTASRSAVTQTGFGLPFVALVHALHGSDATPAHGGVPPVVAGWASSDGGQLDVDAAWQALAASHGVQRAPKIVRAAVRPRTFVVEPGREVIVVVSTVLDTPASRFAAMHELGHALAAFLVPQTLPRAVDEAAAAFVARTFEEHEPLAAAARVRRLALARQLDAVERALPAVVDPPTPHVPWALWHDAGAQAAYVTAEALADRWTTAPSLAAALRDAARGADARLLAVLR